MVSAVSKTTNTAPVITLRRRFIFPPQLNSLRLLQRPWRGHTSVVPLLNAFAFAALARVDIPARIDSHTADRIEKTRIPSAITKPRDRRQCIALSDPDCFVQAIGDINVPLLRVVGKCEIPYRSFGT